MFQGQTHHNPICVSDGSSYATRENRHKMFRLTCLVLEHRCHHRHMHIFGFVLLYFVPNTQKDQNIDTNSALA